MCVIDCFFSTHAQKSENKVISNGGPSCKSDILHNLQQFKTVVGVHENVLLFSDVWGIDSAWSSRNIMGIMLVE